jgi:hypothetical protein
MNVLLPVPVIPITAMMTLSAVMIEFPRFDLQQIHQSDVERIQGLTFWRGESKNAFCDASQARPAPSYILGIHCWIPSLLTIPLSAILIKAGIFG